MTTFGEIVYAVLDLLKERSDDAYYTEEHIIFLAQRMRNLLLDRRYTATRNSTFRQVSEENKQEICLKVELAESSDLPCDGTWLKTTVQVPATIPQVEPKVYAVGDMYHSVVEYVPIERFPFVGYNKWLRNIIYVTKSADGYLYLRSSNEQFLYLEEIKMSGVFSDTVAAAKLSCNPDNPDACDVLQQSFPLESALVPQCIELVLQELLGPRYAPEDKVNNAKDDLGDIATDNRQRTPVASSATPRERREEEEAQE